MKPHSLRVLLIDDHQLFRHGLRMILERGTGLSVVGEAGTVEQALVLAATVEPDVVVADLHLPDGNGIKLAAQVKKIHPSAKVIMLSSDGDLIQVRAALEIGANGYLLNDSSPTELVAAIHAAAKGGLYLSPEIAANLYRHYGMKTSPEPAKPATVLSEREAAVLQFISQGLRNKEMAEQLNVSVKSIETYRRRLLEKLKCTSTVELIRHAIREGLIAP